MLNYLNKNNLESKEMIENNESQLNNLENTTVESMTNNDLTKKLELEK
jgi:hypothetical protein